MFSPRNKETACGMWSPTYFIVFIIILITLYIGIKKSKHMTFQNVKKVLIFDAAFSLITEIIKMIFIGITYGMKEVEFIPLYFCSLFIYMSFLSLSKNEKIKNVGLTFIFYGGIIGAMAFFLYPSACIPNYPIYHFMCLRTIIYHGLMIYTGFLVVLTGYYIPQNNHAKDYFISLSIVGILAFIFNNAFGYNFMYISEPLDFDFAKKIYCLNSYLYSVIILILEITLPYIITSIGYNVLKKMNEKKYIYEMR